MSWGDIGDVALLERVVPGHDAIVHFAAESHNDNSIADPEPFIRTNVEGTPRLVGAAQGSHRGPLPRARAVKRRLLQAALPRQSDVAQQTLHGLKHHGIGNHRK